MPLLEINDLAFHAGDHAILEGFSLTMEASEVHALLGANGTGKSTLAYLIMGCEAYRPSAGAIVFDGKAIHNLTIYERARLGITLAWQEPVRFEGISVGDYLTLGNRRADPTHLLELVGLSADRYRDRLTDKSLSGGERKRIELASVLALNPKLAVLDEPDSGIDLLSTRDIINVINALRENGSAVLLITHREEIALIADRASQLCNGRVICSGAPERVAEHYKVKQCLVCAGGECHYV